jgi:hypothetical protein
MEDTGKCFWQRGTQNGFEVGSRELVLSIKAFQCLTL